MGHGLAHSKITMDYRTAKLLDLGLCGAESLIGEAAKVKLSVALKPH